MAKWSGRAALERAVGALLAANERSIAKVHPVPPGPLDPRRLVWTRGVHDRTPALRAELDAIRDRGPLPTVAELSGSDQGAEGEWTTFVVFAAGRWVASNVARAPELAAAVRDVPDLRTAGYTVLAPGSHIPEHRGPARTLRYQVGVVVPPEPGAATTTVGGVPLHWQEGSELLFDDATLHEAHNDGSTTRCLLFVEVGWELPAGRRALDRVVKALFSRLGAGFVERAEQFGAVSGA